MAWEWQFYSVDNSTKLRILRIIIIVR